MREILFRGKSQYTGKWGESVCPLGLMHSGHLCNDFIPETVGQFTGMTDKNGKKIFEGDVIRCVSRMDEANMVVIFEHGEFRMILCERYKDYVPGGGFYAVRCFDKEVIGNIHDNPEMLNGGLEDGQ